MKFVIALLSILLTNLAVAGLYECSAPDATPTLIEAGSKNVSFTQTTPYTVPYSLDARNNPANKIPFLIYYAIDTEEPFMQLTVKYELAELRKSCEASEKVNFAALLNSAYVDRNTIIICKNKVYQEVKLSNFPAIDTSLNAKRRYIGEGNHSSTELGIMSFLVRYHEINNDVFYDFPLAHPDFVHDLISFVSTEESLFPSEKYMPFLNLKSHGSKKHVLSGLHSCQINAKTKSQNAIMEKVLTEDERLFLKTASFYHHLGYARKALDKLALGASIGSMKNNTLGDYSLGDYSLGDYSLGDYSLGDAMAGLGANEGLGSQFSFGLYHAALSTVLHRLFNDNNEIFLGFVMLESCDTNRNVSFHHEHLTHVLGIYSAQKSLWYRNLNWWTLMESADGSSIKLTQLLSEKSAEIPNIVIKDL